MAILDISLQEKIDELTDLAYSKFEEGKTEESFSLQKQAWDLYPEPKSKWNEAYNTAKYIFIDYLNLGNFDDARIWLDRMIDNNNSLHLSDYEVEHYEAKYYFETKDYKKALEKWQYSVNEAGLRYFEDEDPKYLEFYKNPKKYIK